MSTLRQKMIEDMQLKGLAVRTQETYVNAVWQLSRRYKKSPNCIEAEELREYFLYLKNEKRVAESTFSIALCGIKFFNEHTLGKEWHTLQLVRPDRKKKLPVVLSTDHPGLFFQRFLQHVLPHAFVKVHYDGFFGASVRRQLAALQKLPGKPVSDPVEQQFAVSQPDHNVPSKILCPVCGLPMIFQKNLSPLLCRSP
jgi:hypothetical protein